MLCIEDNEKFSILHLRNCAEFLQLRYVAVYVRCVCLLFIHELHLGYQIFRKKYNCFFNLFTIYFNFLFYYLF